jgi:hypothetical protein
MSASHQHTFPLASCTLASAHTSVKPLGCLHARIIARITLAACEYVPTQNTHLPSLNACLVSIHPWLVLHFSFTYLAPWLLVCISAHITLSASTLASAHASLPLAALLMCFPHQHTHIYLGLSRLPWLQPLAACSLSTHIYHGLAECS